MNILVIAPSWVGDMMMSHALYQQLKIQYPNSQIDVMAPDWSRPLLSRMPEIRQSISMPIGHGSFALAKRYNLGKSLQYQYDMAIVLPNSLKSAFIPFFAKIPYRRGWKGEMRYGLLNDIRSNKQDYPMMVQRYLTLAYEKSSIPSADDLPIIYPKLKVNLAEVAQSHKQFEPLLNGAEGRKVIGFCPGAEFGPAKRYPHYHYANLARMLIEQGYAIHIFGSQKDEPVGESIRQSLSQPQQQYCINLAGKTNLNQAVDLISECVAVVSNDSGLMHIAAALDRPLIALYGPTSPQYTPPLSDKAVIIRLIEGGLIKIRKGEDSEEGYHQSLIDIKPELVLEKLTQLLQNENLSN
ncbi:lipopolysaccharide heptosyltransferase II [Otariodibacter sp.]|uniref:lipopolysaccharide heptosyltransferase II n=1 Tax=Otariodibacter sp. TaxID=3030919 RepID=UPI00262D9F2A|nr:lipopolysaccharide heptosyltransferase II [Otariodibacter sp.]